MRLSEAIRLGSMLRPQARGGFKPVQVRGWRGWLLGQTVPGSCAMAAAAEAVGGTKWTDVHEPWPWLFNRRATCPACEERGWIIEIAWRLNDIHCWTREEIADWIETSCEQAPAEPLATNAVDPVAQTGQEVVRA